VLAHFNCSHHSVFGYYCLAAKTQGYFVVLEFWLAFALSLATSDPTNSMISI
jgi:hypothetical protein